MHREDDRTYVRRTEESDRLTHKAPGVPHLRWADSGRLGMSGMVALYAEVSGRPLRLEDWGRCASECRAAHARPLPGASAVERELNASTISYSSSAERPRDETPGSMTVR